MAFVNYNNKEITAKIVYYGPALSGKTTCLRYIFNCDEIENKGKLITLDTDGKTLAAENQAEYQVVEA